MGIEPIPYDIAAEDAVELIGRSFNFTHHKGLVEWVKNSWDAYQRRAQLGKMYSSHLHVQIRFAGGGKAFRNVGVLDFCGMTYDDIKGAFKRWFDRRAATRGLSSHDLSRITGGHGNGGKFYMRQMFRESRIKTWIDGEYNSFGFDPDKRYGFETGFEQCACSADEALELMGLDMRELPQEAWNAVSTERTGLTLVEGYGARGAGIQTQVPAVLDSLRDSPMMVRLLPHMDVSVWHSDELIYSTFTPEYPNEHSDVEGKTFELPVTLEIDGQSYCFKTEGQVLGSLKIKVADQALTHRRKSWNRLDVMGSFGVVATYPMTELPLKQLDGSEFLMATLECQAIDEGQESLVENARERLISSPKTSALLEWASERIDELSVRVAQHHEQQRHKIRATETAKLTRMLNNYAQQFLNSFYTDAAGGPGVGSGFGGTGGGGGATHTNGEKRKSGSRRGGSGTGGGGSGSESGRVSRFPQIPVAGEDADPLTGETFNLSERHPTLYQRPQDVASRVYWINTEATYPRIILEEFKQSSPVWRNYILMRTRDVVVKEALQHLTSTHGLELTPENVNNHGDEVTEKFLNSLDQTIADSVFGVG